MKYKCEAVLCSLGVRAVLGAAVPEWDYRAGHGGRPLAGAVSEEQQHVLLPARQEQPSPALDDVHQLRILRTGTLLSTVYCLYSLNIPIPPCHDTPPHTPPFPYLKIFMSNWSSL